MPWIYESGKDCGTAHLGGLMRDGTTFIILHHFQLCAKKIIFNCSVIRWAILCDFPKPAVLFEHFVECAGDSSVFKVSFTLHVQALLCSRFCSRSPHILQLHSCHICVIKLSCLYSCNFFSPYKAQMPHISRSA